MHQLDALINGLAFLGLLAGLAIGWTRSRALRETMAELFLPSRGDAQEPSLADNGASASKRGAAQITITWEVYRAQVKTASSRNASKADDPKALRGLRELVEA